MLTITNKPVRKRSVTILSPAGIKEEDTSSDGGGGKFSLRNALVYNVDIYQGGHSLEKFNYKNTLKIK